MQVVDDRLHSAEGTAVAFQATPNTSGAIVPDTIVIHFTGGASAESSIDWLCNPEAKASAHLVIAQDGTPTQLAPFTKKTWHAGRSAYGGRTSFNGFSIGIELDNAGPLVKTAAGWTTRWGAPVAEERVVVAAHKNGGGERGWHSFTDAQLRSCIDACRALVAAYGIKSVLGHDDIAPARKVDPGPAFPMDWVKAQILGRGAEADPGAEHPHWPGYRTTAAVNIRSGPGLSHAVLAPSPLEPGTPVELVAEEAGWYFVDVVEEGGTPYRSGWVFGRYLGEG